jgi:hypothetical protein
MNYIGPVAAFLLVGFSTPALAETIHGTLNKDQHCECCEAHADYLRKNGFDLKIEAVKNLSEMSIEAGVPPGFQGCHIIKINGYVFEGHITSDIIKRLLAEHPQDVVGLSLPGMPSGVPGMEGPRDASLVVYAIKKDGTTKTYATQ